MEAVANNSTSQLINSVDDVEYLLRLEAIKRFNDESKNIQRQVEDQARIYMEAKREYQHLYTRLADINKNANLSKALENEKLYIDDAHVPRTLTVMADVTAKISTDQRPTEFDPDVIKECKNQLNIVHQPRNLLSRHQCNVAQNLETLKAVRSALDTMENGFEATTQTALDQLASEMQPSELNLNQ